MKLTVDEIVRRLEFHEPKEVRTVMRYCKLPLRFIADGAYRDTFNVIGTPVILKIPRTPLETNYLYDAKTCKSSEEEVSNDNVDHARIEFKLIDRIKKYKKFEFLRPFLPEIYHANVKTGVSLVKRYYKIGSKQHQKVIDDLEKKIKKAMNVSKFGSIDLHPGNFAEDKDGSLRLIDFGGFEGW